MHAIFTQLLIFLNCIYKKTIKKNRQYFQKARPSLSREHFQQPRPTTYSSDLIANVEDWNTAKISQPVWAAENKHAEKLATFPFLQPIIAAKNVHSLFNFAHSLTRAMFSRFQLTLPRPRQRKERPERQLTSTVHESLLSTIQRRKFQLWTKLSFDNWSCSTHFCLYLLIPYYYRHMPYSKRWIQFWR